MSDDVTATDVASKEDLEELEELADDEDDEESDAPASLADKVKKQLPFLSKLIPAKKSSKNDDKTNPNIRIQDDEDENEDSGKKSKKSAGKKPNKLIFIVVGIGLVVLFADDFLPKDEEITTEVAVQKPKKKTQRELDKEKAQAEAAAAATTTPPTEAVAETPVEAPVEVPTETPVETPIETITETPTETVIETPTETIVETPTETVIETPTEDIQLPTENTVEAPVISVPSDNASEDQIGMPNDSGAIGGDFTDKILQDLEKQAEDTEKNTPKKRDYVSPPDYEYTGRGLVYNCVGKHWACVDAPSYKTCEQNHEANKVLNKKAECYPFNVYEKTKNCSAAQLMMTSSNAKTGFCNE